MSITLESKLPLRIALVGQTFDESRTVQRASAMQSLGISLKCIPTVLSGSNYETSPSFNKRIRYYLRIPSDPAKANLRVIEEVNKGVDILWLDAADMITFSTLQRAKELNDKLVIIWYSEDDMMNPRMRTRQIERALPLFDLWVTTKSFNAKPMEMPTLGAKKVLFVNNSCDPQLHRSIKVTEEERILFGGGISFIGSFEAPRAHSLLYLAKRGLNVRIWGNGWGSWVNRHPNLIVENRPIYNEDYVKAISASSINLCFLRKANRDLQTCRSIEIPSCSGFMLHERNSEITNLYREAKEAVYFSSDEELFDMCSFWLNRDQHSSVIGEAAKKRTIELGLSHKINIIRVINNALSNYSDLVL